MLILLFKKQKNQFIITVLRWVNRRTTGIRHRVNTEKLTEPAINYELPNLLSPLSSQLDWPDFSCTTLLKNSNCSCLCSAWPEAPQINIIWILYDVYFLLPKLKPGTESGTKD